ncbi:OmpA family protein [Jannaschia aquimarina]|uniref:Outer membrane lipoprotein Omp16 n=1 Tax=Jannaschia aquimarina TaxID=935700 RepID=A0A0D1EFS1_9RHOB|nr:OmpA family protein [Jannaschia aquimarina]KIT16534.1 Outer membrane lipoprotein Omp16 precursor [Jannaschia aquimarina]SNT06295.1 Outer membrane protein OmpA [Jannaschia aquimarina]
MDRKLSRRSALLGLTGFTLTAAGCGRNGFNDPAGEGYTIDGFGAATRNNIGVHNGEITALVHLGERFEASVPTTVTFAFNSAELDADARAILEQQADFIRTFPEVRFSVYGHTDLVGSNAYNRRLGLRRARAAVNYISARGVSKDRLEALVSRGETDPVVPTEGRERANRRTVTKVTGFVQSHPLILDGKYAQVIYRNYVGSSGRAATVSNQGFEGGGEFSGGGGE